MISGQAAVSAFFVNTPYSEYLITEDIDLTGCIPVALGAWSVLRFQGGRIMNGTLQGNGSSIEVPGDGNVFVDVVFTGSWKGYCNDRYFSYNSSGHANFVPILKNLLYFDTIDLSRAEYFIQWTEVVVPGNHPICLNGNGAIFYIGSDKGTVIPYDPDVNVWGPSYATGTLISFNANRRKFFCVKNLTIEDNAATSPYTGYGEANVYQEHTRYAMFEGLAFVRTEFINVKYDGGGQFYWFYNDVFDARQLVFKDCDLHSNGFAIELACRRRTEGQTVLSMGSLEETIIDNCIIHNHYSRFVGVLSFVGEIGIKHISVADSKICGYRGNLEMTGVDDLQINNCVFVNHGISMEDEGHHTVVRCIDCQFYLTEPFPNATYVIKGETVFVENCLFYINQYITFDNIDRLFFFNNNLVVPSSAFYVMVTNPTVKIGYYRGNYVSSTNIVDRRVKARLDTSYVTAQFEPFKLTYKKDSLSDVLCYTFNSIKGFKKMSELTGITCDSEGYACTNGEQATLLSPNPVYNETITVSLVGKSISSTGIHSLVSVPFGDYSLFINQHYGFMFNVYLNQFDETTQSNVAQVILNLDVADYIGQDVRLDVTVTQINGYFEVFVFVNMELFAKYRTNALTSFTPGNLLFTPYPSTVLKEIRYLTGGMIVDEPDTLLTDRFDIE